MFYRVSQDGWRKLLQPLSRVTTGATMNDSSSREQRPIMKMLEQVLAKDPRIHAAKHHLHSGQ